MKCWIDDCNLEAQLGSNYCQQHIWQSTVPRFEDRGGSGEGDPPPDDDGYPEAPTGGGYDDVPTGGMGEGDPPPY